MELGHTAAGSHMAGRGLQRKRKRTAQKDLDLPSWMNLRERTTTCLHLEGDLLLTVKL